MAALRVRDLLQRKEKILCLELLAGEDGLDREIPGPEISSPGLALGGYTDRFVADRIQVLGETEISYLESLTEAECHAAVDRIFEFYIPCLIVTKDQEVPAPLKQVADERGVPLLRSAFKTGDFYRRIRPYLDEEFAPSTAIHGSLADVYGVGLLFVGRSGIGKSECVLDLVERGHRVVADDVVLVHRRGNDVLIGQGHDYQRHHMEIRGIGIIDVRALFGIHATRQQKRIEVVVQLEEWKEDAYYDRTGLDAETTTILEVELPLVVVPLNPGKNITVIAEVVAMNHLLRYAGVDSAGEFNRELRRRIAQPTRDYLEEDYE
ncbi:MAG: HPr(Ser) kinase/phosphatase [Gemmatimonadota bacterium]